MAGHLQDKQESIPQGSAEGAWPAVMASSTRASDIRWWSGF